MSERINIMVEMIHQRTSQKIRMSMEDYRDFIKSQHELFYPMSEVFCGELIINDGLHCNQVTGKESNCNGNCKCMNNKGGNIND